MEEDMGKTEKLLQRLMDYHAEQKVDFDGMLIMLSLINLMSMINLLNTDHNADGQAAGPGNQMNALLGSLMSLFAAGMGKGASSGQETVNPANLLNILGAGQGKGGMPDLSMLAGLLGSLMGGQGKAGMPDLSGLLALLGPLMGAGGQMSGGIKTGVSPGPVQREINLDEKNKTVCNQEDKLISNGAREREGKIPKSGEVLKWEFGA